MMWAWRAVLAGAAAIVAAIVVAMVVSEDELRDAQWEEPIDGPLDPSDYRVHALYEDDDEPSVITERPADGHIRGLTANLDVRGYGLPDKVRVRTDRGNGGTVPLRPMDGFRWLVLDVVHEPLIDHPSDATAETVMGLVVDGEWLKRIPEDLGAEPVRVVSVPDDAEAVALVVADGDNLQTLSLLTGERVGTPLPLAGRRIRTAPVDADPALPFEADTRSSVDADRRLELHVGAAALYPAVLTEGLTDRTEDRWAQHQPSGPDRALLMLEDVEARWTAGSVLRESALFAGYRLQPTDLVLTLADGTAIPATAPPPDRRFCSPVAGCRYSPPGDQDDHPDILGPGVVFDVPADITEATITIRPTNGPVDRWDTTVDFLGGSLSFEVRFPPG